LPTTLRYHYLSSLELNNALDNNFGLRIKKQFSGLDLSAVAFEGAANTPAVNLARITANATSLFPTLTFVVDPDVYLQAAYYKTRVYGASAVLAAGDFLLKAESAYTKPISVRNDLPERVIESVFGIERTMALGAGSLTTLLQGSYGDRKEAANTSSTSLARIFDRGAMIALRYMPSEKLTWLSSFLRDTKYKGNFIHSDINYALSDTVKISAGAEFLKGDAETPLGTYEKNDRVMLGFNCHW